MYQNCAQHEGPFFCGHVDTPAGKKMRVLIAADLEVMDLCEFLVLSLVGASPLGNGRIVLVPKGVERQK